MTPEQMEVAREGDATWPGDVSGLGAVEHRRWLLAEVDRLRVENERLQREADNPALRDSVMAGLDRELEAAYREELKAQAEAKRLRGVLTRIVDDPGDAYHHARRALEGTP